MSLKGAFVERATPDEQPSMAVISAVANATNSDPSDLEPLYEVIDTDALDSLFEASPAGPWRAGGRVSFTFEGCDVVVYGDGRVVVKPPGADEITNRLGDTN